MLHENIRVLEASPHLDNERSTDGNEQQRQILRIEETNQQPIVPGSFMNKLRISFLVGSATTRPVILSVRSAAQRGMCGVCGSRREAT